MWNECPVIEMDLVHVVFVCGRDADFISDFAAAWYLAWGDVAELVFAVDELDPVPVVLMQGHRCVWSSWPRVGAIAVGVVAALKEVAEMTGARWIFKCDVDVVHLARRWFDRRADGAQLVGWRNERRGGIYGGCYAISEEALGHFEPEMKWSCQYEDKAMSEMATQLGLMVDAQPTDDLRKSAFRGVRSLGWEIGQIGPFCDAVHTGEGGKCARARARSAAWQRLLVDNVAAGELTF